MENKRTFTISNAAEDLIPNKDNRNAYLLALLCALALSVGTILIYNKLPERIPLLLTEPWGEGRLVAKVYLYLLNASIVVVVAINILLSKLWGGGGILIQRILSITALIFALCTVLSYWGVVQSFFL